MRVIGLMSGTSHDAIEAAAADLSLDGDALLLRPLGHLSVPYPDELRHRIAAALPPAHTTMGAACALDTGIGQAFAGVAGRALRDLCAGTADLVVSHGQTMHHWVEDGTVRGTLQLGQPAWIAEATGLPVVSDLRSRDVAAGGQGAPLVALTDALLLSGLPGTPAALNLGGIANITVLAPGAEPLAFDTGPANALLDAAVHHFTDGAAAYDEDGRRAGAGQVSPGLLRVLLDDPYYRRPAPKSTGKEHFHLPYLRRALDTVPVPATADVLATLTRLTAVTVADACRAHGVTRLVVSGGGTR
ncbi:anhydro-N-acetylmuramic acid kinase, partial [Streptomyces eurythermus]